MMGRRWMVTFLVLLVTPLQASSQAVNTTAANVTLPAPSNATSSALTTATRTTSWSTSVLPTTFMTNASVANTTEANATSPFGDTLQLLTLGPLSSCVRSSQLFKSSSCTGVSLTASFAEPYRLLTTLPLVRNTTNLPEKLLVSGLQTSFSLINPLTILLFVVIQSISLLLRVPHLILAMAGDTSSLRASVESSLSKGREAQLCRLLALSNMFSMLFALALFGVSLLWRSKISTAVKVFNASNSPMLLTGQRYGIKASVGTTFGIWYLVAVLALVAAWVEKRRVRQQSAVAIAKQELLAQAARQQVAEAKQRETVPAQELLPPAPAYSPPEKVEFGHETMSWRLVGDKSGRIYN